MQFSNETKCKFCNNELIKQGTIFVCKNCGRTYEYGLVENQTTKSIDREEDATNYNKALKLIKERKFIDALIIFNTICDFKDSRKKIMECEKYIYESAVYYMKNKKYNEAIPLFEYIKYYSDSVLKLKQCKSLAFNAEQEKIYQTALSRVNKPSVKNFEKSIEELESIKNYKDSLQQSKNLKNKYNDWKKKCKKKKISFITSLSLLVFGVVTFYCLVNFVIPSNKYKQAKQLYFQQEYLQAKQTFESIKNWGESEKYIAISGVSNEIKTNLDINYNELVIKLLDVQVEVGINYFYNGVCIEEENYTTQTSFTKIKQIEDLINKNDLGYSYIYKASIDYNIYYDSAFVINLKIISNVLTHDISYSLDGGIVEENPTRYTIESRAIILNNPTKLGYNFLGWTGTDLISPTQNVIIKEGSTGNREYVANWEAITYFVSYNLNGGALEETNPESYTIESNDITLNNPFKAGYVFTGWTGTNLTQPTQKVIINKGSIENREYIANWTIVSYLIIYNLDGGTLETANLTNYNAGTSTFTLNNPTKFGYSFVGWTGTDITEPTKAVTINKGSVGSRNYTANWEPLKYSINYNLNGGELLGNNPTSYTIVDDIEINNPTKAGYSFEGWTGTDIIEITQNVVIHKGSTGNREYTASWKPLTYSIVYNLNGGELTKANPTTYTIEDENITLNKPTKEGYNFAGWIGTDIIEPTQDVTISKGCIGDRKYIANWEYKNYMITYILNGGAETKTNPVSYTMNSDSIVIYNPTRTGYAFSGWTGTDIDEPTKTLKINKGSIGDREYIANWEIISYSINYKINGGKVEQLNPTSYTINDEDITLNSPIKKGYTFIGWTGTKLTELTPIVVISKGSYGYREFIANWEIINYSIKYDLNGGIEINENPTAFTIESENIILNNPTKTGYNFIGWTSIDITEPMLNVTINKGSVDNREYVANWKVIDYSITYKINGGKVEHSNPISYTINDEDITLNNPTKKGYNFAGWSGTELKDLTQIVVIGKGSYGHRVYVANWEIITYTITYNLDGGTDVYQNPTIYTVESEDIIIKDLAKQGYKFVGWTGINLTEPVQNVTINKGSIGDREFTANWEIINYSIKYDLNGGIEINENPTAFTIESEDIVINNPTKIGYEFMGWTGTNLTELTQNISISKGSTQNRKYVANWKVIEYTLTYILNGGAVDKVNPRSYTVESEDITLYKPTQLGYNFVGWTGTDLTEPIQSVTINKGSIGDREYIANWELKNYTITYNLNDGQELNQNPTTYTIVSDEIILNNPIKTGYDFVGWIGSNGDQPELNVTIPTGSHEDKLYIANWRVIIYTINYTLNGGTVSKLNQRSYTIESEDIVLNNPTKTGYDFVGWTGTDLTEPTENVIIKNGSFGDREYIANWEITKYSIIYNLDGAETDNPTYYTIHSEDIILNNPTRKGYDFIGWTGSNGNILQMTVTIKQGSTGNKEYNANWQIIAYSITYNLDGGVETNTNPTTYNVESELTLNNPTKTGYKFIGWLGIDLNELTENVTINKGSIGDREYVANWEVIIYTITYNLNGGELFSHNPENYTINTPTFVMNYPTKSGYNFIGWTGTDLIDPIQNVVISQGSTGNRKYVANWDTITYTIVYKGGGVAEGNPLEYTCESEEIKLDKPKRIGYSFEGWTGTDLDDLTMEVIIPKSSMGNREYTAHWTIISYLIEYDLDGGSVNNPTTYTIETETFILNNPTKIGCVFKGWTGTYVFDLTQNVPINQGSYGDKYFLAHWEYMTYSISYDLNGGNVLLENPTTYTVLSEDIILINPTKLGYNFAGWSGTDLNEPTQNVTISKGSVGDREYTANWQIINYSITYDLKGGRLLEENPTSYNIETSTFVLNNPTKQGYIFEGWMGTDLAELTQDVLIYNGSVGDREYIASWQIINYSISYDLGGGDVSPENPTTYNIETPTFTLYNPVMFGYTFTGWLGTNLDELTQIVTINNGSHGDRVYVANWKINNIKLSTPTNLQFSQQNDIVTISWDSVESANTYEVIVNDTIIEYECYTTFVTIDISQFDESVTSIFVKIRANGYDHFLTSDYLQNSEGYKFVVTLNAPIINNISIKEEKIIASLTVYKNDYIIAVYSSGELLTTFTIGFDNTSAELDLTKYITESKTYSFSFASLSYNAYTRTSSMSDIYKYNNLTPFPSPTITSITCEDNTNILIKWSEVDGATMYNVYVNETLYTTVNTLYISIPKTKITELNDGGYYFNVQAVGNENHLDSILGESVYFEVKVEGLTIPTGIKISDHNQGFIVEWNEVDTATHYSVAIDNEIYTTTQTSYIYKTTNPIPYQIMLKAHNETQSTDFSEKHMFNKLDTEIEGYTDKYIYFSGWQDYYANTIDEFNTLCKYTFFSYDYTSEYMKIYLNSSLGIDNDNWTTYFEEASNTFGTCSLSFGGYVSGNILKVKITYRNGTDTPPDITNSSDYAPNPNLGYYHATTPTRSNDYNNFTTETSLIEMPVGSTNDLYICAEGRAKPVFKENNYNAEQCYEQAKEILRTIITDDMTEYQKTLAIYDYINYISVYDSYYTDEIMDNARYWIEGPLLYGVGVCDGFSKLFSLLCNMEGIETIKITGYVIQNGSQGGHAWNKVKLDLDGNGEKEWYNVDLTWDGIRFTENGTYYETSTHRYFLVTDEQISEHYAYDDPYIANTSFDFYDNYEIGNGYDLHITSQNELKAYFTYASSNQELMDSHDVYISSTAYYYLSSLLSKYGASGYKINTNIYIIIFK